MTKKQKLNVAILGATGLVGETLLSILAERQFPIQDCFALASENSLGETVLFKNKPLLVQDAKTFDFSQVDLAFFAVNDETAAHYAPIAKEAGCFIIDLSAAFRLDPAVPLVVPEVNPEAIAYAKESGMIANPNCATIQLVVALKPILDTVGLKRVQVASYQSVSGTGKKAISELAGQAAQLLNGQAIEPEVYPEQIAFNLIPAIDRFSETGYTREELKMIQETQKILGTPTLSVSATAVRVPIFYGHSEVVYIETTQRVDLPTLRETLQTAPGLVLMGGEEDINAQSYPTPLKQMKAGDAVYLGRLRADLFSDTALTCFIVADNVRKGGALNAVQIAEIWLNDYFSN